MDKQSNNQPNGFDLDNMEITDWETLVLEQPKGLDEAKLAKKWKRKIISVSVATFIIIVMYITVLFSNSAFIVKWRTIYIETAMTTNSHQWLATLLFPRSMIDEIMANRKSGLKSQKDLTGTWDDYEEDAYDPDQEDFFKVYWELDTDSFRDFLKKHPELVENGYHAIHIEDFSGDLHIKTQNRDELVVLDTANHLMIVSVKGDGYQGKLAILKDPEQLTFAKSRALGSFGQEAESFGADYDALLVVNASGFKDVHGEGSGGEVKGCLVQDGVDYGHPELDYAWKLFGFKKNNRMYIYNYSAELVKEFKWAMQFFPALIVNGESVVDGTYGMGIQPRAAFGQAENGDVLMLVVDGRQVGYSIGCTVEDCKNILYKYHAYQAMNLDGGSSAVMWYDGRYITKSSSVTGKGRYMPDAFVVNKVEESVVVEAAPEK